MPAAEAATAVSTDHLLTAISTAIGMRRALAIAVSGGSDSMALLRLCQELSHQRGIRLTALTVDHGLRPESASEACQVAAWCTGQGIPHQTLQWQGSKPVTGIQAAARNARYDLMTRWCSENNVAALLTAHTRDDQAETVAMRKRRSLSARSRAGIWPEIMWQGVHVLRPLLETDRAELRAYLRQSGQDWIDDPSNHNTAFERIRLRQTLEPFDRISLAGEAAQAQGAVTATMAKAGAWLASHALQHEAGFLELSRTALNAAPDEWRIEILRRLLAYTSQAVLTPRNELQRLAEWTNGDNAASQRRTLAGCLFAKRKNTILVAREWSRIEPVQTVPPSGHLVWDGRYRIGAPPGSFVRPAGLAAGVQRPEGIPAYVFYALPVVDNGNDRLVLPQFAPISGQNTEIRCEIMKF